MTTRNGRSRRRRAPRARRREQREPTPLQAAIDAAVKNAGGLARLAQACCVSAPAISKARRTGRISPVLAMNIHHATKGEVPRHVLRPDLWDNPEKA